jgi:Zn-dependent M28 family amino/carboxypeptidase
MSTVAGAIPATGGEFGTEHGLTDVRARFRIDWRPGTYPTENVIAETKGGDPDNVIVVGAHLDSVGTGPGINDNGSGSSSTLEIADQIAKMKLRNKVRFVWFGAEESGLLGAEAYVASLSPAERAKVKAMLNFDMIGSPNFARLVYDGDLSDSEEPECGAPDGSAEIEDTPEQDTLFGGSAGEWLDPCYHQGCDNIFNLSTRALDQMSDAAAHATYTLAQARDLPGGGAPAATARSLTTAPRRRAGAVDLARAHAQ